MKEGIFYSLIEIDECLDEMKSLPDFHPFFLDQTTPRIDEWWWGCEKRKVISEIIEFPDTKIWHTGDKNCCGLLWNWFVFYSPTQNICVVGYL